MPVMDGYEATRILRTGREYAFQNDDDDNDEVLSIKIASGKEEEENGVNGKGELGRGKGRKGRLSDIPVIAMTASAIQGDREKCHEAGMDDYLAKPVEKAKLEAMLVKWARSGRG